MRDYRRQLVCGRPYPSPHWIPRRARHQLRLYANSRMPLLQQGQGRAVGYRCYDVRTPPLFDYFPRG
jgi:hypothetical protein